MAEVVDRVVAVVNDDIVLLSELNQSLIPYVKRLNASDYSEQEKDRILYKLKHDSLEALVERRLVDQEVKRHGLSVSDGEVDATIERYKEKQYMTQDALEQALQEDGMTFADYREKVRQELLRPKLINISVKSKVVITDEDIKAFYEANKSLYEGEKQYHLYNILIKKEEFSITASGSDGKDVINGIKSRIDKGEDFKALAQEMSQASNAADGGDLGFFKLETFSPELKEAIVLLHPGEVTDIITTGAGYQIFFLEEIKETPGKPFEEVSDQIHADLYNDLVKKKFQTWLQSIKEKAHIKLML